MDPRTSVTTVFQRMSKDKAKIVISKTHSSKIFHAYLSLRNKVVVVSRKVTQHENLIIAQCTVEHELVYMEQFGLVKSVGVVRIKAFEGN